MVVTMSQVPQNGWDLWGMLFYFYFNSVEAIGKELQDTPVGDRLSHHSCALTWLPGRVPWSPQRPVQLIAKVVRVRAPRGLLLVQEHSSQQGAGLAGCLPVF